MDYNSVINNNDLVINNNDRNKDVINYQNEKKNKSLNLEQIICIIKKKINNSRTIEDKEIEEFCENLKLYCINYNSSLNEWFDEKFNDELKELKNNNLAFFELSCSFNNNSIISVEKH